MESEEKSEKLVFKIYKNMEYEEKSYEGDSNGKFCDVMDKTLTGGTLNEGNPIWNTIETAVRAQVEWKSISALKRANKLHKIWETLSEKSNLFSGSHNFSKNEYSHFVAYFDFYSDLTASTDEYKNWKPYGVVLVLFSNDCPFFILGSILACALGAGNSIIIQLPNERAWFPLILADIFSEVRLPMGLFNVVPNDLEMNKEMLLKNVNHVIFCGNYTEAQSIYSTNLSTSFNFVSPNNTAAIILESCDLSAAIDKIVTETWGSDIPSMWAVSTVVIQESIYEKFLMELKFRLTQIKKVRADSSKFYDKSVLSKVKNMMTDATKAGAVVEKYWINDHQWGPTIILEHQDPDAESCGAVLNVLTCRTAKEGVALLNNSRYSLGTSIWTEISSQALEIASKLLCSNIWVNCHGVAEATVPLQASGYSGNFVFGGCEGFFEYMSYVSLDSNQVETARSYKDEGFCLKKKSILEIVQFAEDAFRKWCLEKNKRKYLKALADLFEKDKELSKLCETINYNAHLKNLIKFSGNLSNQEFFVIQTKIPLGVIAVICNDFDDEHITNIVSLLTGAVALGNTIILALREKNSKIIEVMKHFNNVLPKNIISVVIGCNASSFLASHPVVKVLWLFESKPSKEYLQMLKNHSRKTMKHVRIISENTPLSQHLFLKECLKNKVIWLANVDQFPQ